MLSILFSAAWQWLLGRFGMSDAQKLGRAEVTSATQGKIIQEVKKADETDALDARMSDDALKLRYSRFKRPD